MIFDAQKDPPVEAPDWNSTETSIDGVRHLQTRHITTKNGSTTEYFRSDLPETDHEIGHVIAMEWPRRITTNWHCHTKQTDHLSTLQGSVLACLVDGREHSPTAGVFESVALRAEAPSTLIVPPGVFHAFKVLSAPVILLNSVTHVFEYKDPDHWRIRDASAAGLPDLDNLE